ncbi:MAG: pilus assembly protein TadG-related protein, partial [Hyphomicrobiaceae bacterium]
MVRNKVLQRGTQKVLRAFHRDRRGSIAIVFALSITTLIALVGGAVDYGRWMSARSATLNAMDAAVLAGGRVLQLAGATDAEAQAAAEKYYAQNKSDGLSIDGTVFSINSSEVIATSASTVSTPFLSVIGIDSLAVNLTSKAVLAAGSNAGSHIEVAMMLDTTGSMSGSKMDDLKEAAKDLVEIVVWSDQSTYTSRVALAPFSRYVNVGTGYFNAVTNATAGGGTNERTCVKERPTADRYTDAPPGAGNFFAYYSGSGVCDPTSTIMPLTSNKAVLTAHIDSMPTIGMTAGHLGTAWAWYLISPRWASVWPSASMPNSYSMLTESSDPGSSAAPGDPDFKPKLHKIAILMTDGAYNKYYSG